METDSLNRTLRVLVIETDGYFDAQCLEYNIGVSASSIEELKRRFEDVVYLEQSEPGFLQLEAAPEHFHDLWNQARVIESSSADRELRLAA